MFRFAASHALYALALIPLLGLLLWWSAGRARRALDRFGDAPLVRALSESVNRRARAWKTALVVAAVTLLVVALARPQFGSRIETVRRRASDIVIALDLSNSMRAADITPSRLARAKLAIGSLIRRLRGDRVALVAFAGDAFVQCPLTVDYAAAQLFLNAMDPSIVSVQGTNLDAALSAGLGAFREQGEQDRILVLLTDGEDHEGSLDDVLGRAAKAGVRIYTVGMGGLEGVPIPEFDAAGNQRGFKRDGQGQVVTTRLDEATLRHIAERTGGKYYHATPRGAELEQLTSELASAGKQDLEAQQVTRFEEQFQVFLGFALVLLIAEAVIPSRKRLRGPWAGRVT